MGGCLYTSPAGSSVHVYFLSWFASEYIDVVKGSDVAESFLVSLQCHFSWHAQYLVKLECNFSLQPQYLVKLQCHFSWHAQ